MDDITRGFTVFTAQLEPANRNCAAASVHRNKQNGVFIACVLCLSPQFHSPQFLLHRLVSGESFNTCDNLGFAWKKLS